MADGNAREGGDITADHMIAHAPEGPSEIQNFYAGSVVFITGATGFLGKLILEKLLRTCPDVKTIYILMRPKKGKDIEKRFEEMFENVLFERLKRERPLFLDKVAHLSGDCSLPDLGLDDKDRTKLIEEVDCIFHCAATVRFDEKIRTAAYINVRACRDLIRICKQMKNLRAMVHISTAYSNCPRSRIEECFYDVKTTGEKLLNVVNSLDDQVLEKITPTLIGEWPNTYVYTKAVAEEVIKTEGEGLPITVVRPSIVIATASEPVAGWIDNLYGATGVLVGAAMGVLRSLHAKADNLADMVPADYVINNAIAAAWDIATMKKLEETIGDGNKTNEKRHERDAAAIYNCVSTPENPLTWHAYMKLSEKHAPQIPSPLCIWHYCFALRSNYYWHMFCVLFLHYIPAYIVDFVAICIGKKAMTINDNKEISTDMSSREEKYEKEIPIYNYVSTPEKPITWRKYMELGVKHGFEVPSPLVLWYYCFSLNSNYYWHMFLVLFLQYVPAYIIDFIAYCIGKKPMMVKAYGKVGKFSHVISHFTLREWFFTNDNVKSLWRRLGPRDKTLFPFNMTALVWDAYFYTYLRGTRVYLLKDPMDTIPQGRVKYRRLLIAHYTLITLVAYLAYKILRWTLTGVL